MQYDTHQEAIDAVLKFLDDTLKKIENNHHQHLISSNASFWADTSPMKKACIGIDGILKELKAQLAGKSSKFEVSQQDYLLKKLTIHFLALQSMTKIYAERENITELSYHELNIINIILDASSDKLFSNCHDSIYKQFFEYYNLFLPIFERFHGHYGLYLPTSKSDPKTYTCQLSDIFLILTIGYSVLEEKLLTQEFISSFLEEELSLHDKIVILFSTPKIIDILRQELLSTKFIERTSPWLLRAVIYRPNFLAKCKTGEFSLDTLSKIFAADTRDYRLRFLSHALDLIEENKEISLENFGWEASFYEKNPVIFETVCSDIRKIIDTLRTEPLPIADIPHPPTKFF